MSRRRRRDVRLVPFDPLPADRALRVSEAARQLGVCGKTVRRWIAAGKLLAIQLPGGHWRIGEAAIRALGREPVGKPAGRDL